MVRIIVGISLAVMVGRFLWFMSQVIYLGVREFFKIHNVKESKNTDENS